MRFLKTNRARTALLVLAILIQAAGLLLFPIALRQMVDIGVRQSGMLDAVPVKLRAQTLEDLRLFMRPEDYKTIHDAYTIEDGVCTLNADADKAALNEIFAPAERYYLRTVQKGGNAMAAARAAMESGAMTQTQLFEQAKDGLNTLSPAQATAAGIAFLRSEYSVLGMEPNAMRAAYLTRWTWILIGAAAVLALTKCTEQRLRAEQNPAPIPKGAARLLSAAGALALALWALVELAPDWVRPGAFAMGMVALGQLGLSLLPAALAEKREPDKPKGTTGRLLCALPAILGAAGASLAVFGAARACAGAVVVNTGLNRVLAAGGADAAALRQALIPGGLMTLCGIGMIFAARYWDKRQAPGFTGPFRTALELLPGLAGMVTALVLVLVRRFWLGALLLVALAASIGLMAQVQNKRPYRVAAAVALPGHIACAILAGVGANLCARSTLDAGAFLACVLAGLIFTRTGAKLLTRR